MAERESPKKRLIYVCHCGCPRIRRSAEVSVNDPTQVSTIDGVNCPECNYEGHLYYQVPVDPSFSLDDSLAPGYVQAHGTEVFL